MRISHAFWEYSFRQNVAIENILLWTELNWFELNWFSFEIFKMDEWWSMKSIKMNKNDANILSASTIDTNEWNQFDMFML